MCEGFSSLTPSAAWTWGGGLRGTYAGVLRRGDDASRVAALCPRCLTPLVRFASYHVCVSPRVSDTGSGRRSRQASGTDGINRQLNSSARWAARNNKSPGVWHPPQVSDTPPQVSDTLVRFTSYHERLPRLRGRRLRLSDGINRPSNSSARWAARTGVGKRALQVLTPGGFTSYHVRLQGCFFFFLLSLLRHRQRRVSDT